MDPARREASKKSTHAWSVATRPVKRSMALAGLTALVSIGSACKPPMNQETMVMNSAISFQGADCGRNAAYFSQEQERCVTPSLIVRRLAFDPADEPQLPLAHVQASIDFDRIPIDNFGNIAFTYGHGRIATPMRPQLKTLYRVTDFYSPGVQALAGMALIGPQSLPGTYSAVWAALSATTQRVEFPKFSPTQFVRYFTEGNPEAKQIRFVKEFAPAELAPLSDPKQPRAFDLDLGKMRFRQDVSAMHQRRNQLLLPGDVLLVMERTAPVAGSSTAGGAGTAGTAKAAGAGTTGSPPASGTTVKGLVAQSNNTTGEDTGCIRSGKLVHAAILVERDVYFDPVITRRGAFFRIGLFDDLVVNAQVSSGKPLASLCFAVVRRELENGQEAALPLAGQFGPTFLLAGFALAPQQSSAPARDVDAPVTGRLQAIGTQSLVPLALVPISAPR